MNNTDLKFHPIADLFPLMEGDEFDGLALDIRLHGQLQPIITYQGMILDGRNRYLACKSADVEPLFKEYTGNDPAIFVTSMNIERRHLTPTQRACIGVELMPFYQEDARKRQIAVLKQGDELPVVELIPEREKGRSRDFVAEKVHVNPRYITDATMVKNKSPELYEEMKSGIIHLKEAMREVHKIEREEEQERFAELSKSVTLSDKWNVKTGQIWKLGSHLLMCGDAYNSIDRNAVIAELKIDAVITDPPYGIGYKPEWEKWNGDQSDYKEIIGDDRKFDPSPFLNYPTVLFFGANYFSDVLPVGGWVCWDKRLSETKDAMFGSPFELAWFKTCNTSKKAIMVRVLHGGVINADSQLGNNEKRLHATQKPIAVMAKVIEQLTKVGDIIFDPFSGSGSTLIACQLLKRKCITMEIDTNYAAIILQRFYETTNINPEIIKQ